MTSRGKFKQGRTKLADYAFFSVPHVCGTIEGLMSICYDWLFDDIFTFTDVASVPISNI
jgi:hypothetical protein